MSFKDLLDKYNCGNLSEEEIKLIKEELDKYKSIQSYLSEGHDVDFEKDNVQANVNNETTILEKTANNKLRKTILSTISITFLILFTVYHVASSVVSSFYYNPSQKKVSQYSEDLYFDLKAFTELNSPGYTVTTAPSKNLGFGVYDISFHRTNLFNDERRDVNAKIKRNILIGDHQDFPGDHHLGFMEIMYSDMFKRDLTEKQNEKRNEVINYIKELNSLSYISANVIFKEDLSIEEFTKLKEKYPVKLKWAGVRTVSNGERVYYLSGFNPNYSDGSYTNDITDKDKYPYLQLFDYISEHRGPIGDGFMEEGYTKHFISLLRYANDRPKSVKVLEPDYGGVKREYYKNALIYVEENGINIYGALVYGEAKDLLEFINNEEIKTIEINGVLPSKYIN
ncbi:anti sigma factor C-terminal domain-containing protein [uncultured Clostridium sp.]|uniref:anti sigma factor C-terminal domain-containing protein n=1 Tax=uncultured Clostridium sp. TaxID=59620 RepID=UPI0028E86460|nr:anti sigma factor C-terminal domain-containing protein [uncultured Clostridium sp.]